MAYGSSEDVEIAALGSAGVGLMVAAMFIQAWLVAGAIALIVYLLGRVWGQVLLLGSTLFGFFYLHSFSFTSEVWFVSLPDNAWALLAMVCAGFLVFCFILMTVGGFFYLLAEIGVATFIFYVPLFILLAVGWFWSTGTDIIPFFDLPAQFNYADILSITKG